MITNSYIHKQVDENRINTLVYKDKKMTKLHCVDGPAALYQDIQDDGTIITDTEFWYQDDKLHRIDGPAYIEYEGGEEVSKDYWFEGQQYHVSTQEEFFEALIKNGLIPQPDVTKTHAPCDGKIVEIEGVKYKLALVN